MKDIDVTSGKAPDTPYDSQDKTEYGEINASTASVDNDDEFDRLDISSLEESDDKEDDEIDQVELAHNAEALFYKTLSMLESGEIDTSSAVMLLQKSAKDGCDLSALYLGGYYSDPKNAGYNPVFAYDNYLLSAQLGSSEGCYKLGLCLSSGFGCEKDPSLAYELFKRGAECDDADCICALGICYEQGLGCKTDYSVATELYLKATALGHAAAINNLGGMYFYGHGVEQDKEKAISLYRQAAALGHANAECRLALCYENGTVLPKDLSLAFNYYKSAAEKKNTLALYKLALCYDNGWGTEQNFAKAYKCYEKAAKLGHTDAMYEAGKMALGGRGTKKNLSIAYKMFNMAKDALPRAEFELANCLFEGLGTVRNRAAAYSHYLSALERDPKIAGAAYRLGICKLKGLGCEKDLQSAYEYFTLGASLGSTDAAYMKGECEYFGVGTSTDLHQAAESFTASLENTQIEPEFTVPSLINLGLCYERGTGVSRDVHTALKLYKKAAEFGDPNAMYRVGHLMFSSPELKNESSSARIYILRAARKNHLSAMLTMGLFSESGNGVQKNREDAIRWYTKAVSTEIPSAPALFDFPERFETVSRAAIRARIEAQYKLGMLIARHKPSTERYIQAFECIALAASTGHKGAQTEISKIFVSGGDLKSYYDSPFSREDVGFSNGNSEPDAQTLASALNKLGDAFFDGKGLVSKNQSAAVRCYKSSAELGNIDAAYNYGWCLRHGTGVKENDLEAIKWLKSSADRGNANAAYSYGLCCEEGAGTGIKNRRDALEYYRKAAASGHGDAANRYVMLSERDN